MHPLTHFRLLQEVLFFNTFIFVFFLNHEVKSTYLFLFLTVPYYDSSRQHQISPHCPSPINISINFSLLNLIFIKSVPFLIVLQVKGSFTPTIVSDIRPNRLHPEKKGVNFDEKRGKTKIFVWGKFIEIFWEMVKKEGYMKGVMRILGNFKGCFSSGSFFYFSREKNNIFSTSRHAIFDHSACRSRCDWDTAEWVLLTWSGLTIHSLTHSRLGPTSIFLPGHHHKLPTLRLPSRVGVRARPPGNAISLHVSLNSLRALPSDTLLNIYLYNPRGLAFNRQLAFIYFFFFTKNHRIHEKYFVF